MVERHYLAAIIAHRALPNCIALFNCLSLYIFYNPLLALKICLGWYPELEVGATILIEVWKYSSPLLSLNSDCGKFPTIKKTPKWPSQNAAAYCFKLWSRSLAQFHIADIFSGEDYDEVTSLLQRKSHRTFPSFSCAFILICSIYSKRIQKCWGEVCKWLSFESV